MRGIPDGWVEGGRTRRVHHVNFHCKNTQNDEHVDGVQIQGLHLIINYTDDERDIQLFSRLSLMTAGPRKYIN